ncbi:MAG: T9SS type A sorting domain-containing protein [Bacteroidia bacterium]
MKKNLFLLLFYSFLLHLPMFSQNPPWKNALKMAWSSDGVTFGASSIFQDSAGVPSVIRWKGDTLITAFQWFRQPNPSPTWDRVAVKFSYNNGLTWTAPTPIIVNGIPSTYQRPFDPTLVLLAGDSLRMYFSSSATMQMGGLDSMVDTYSATSLDGIHYVFEPTPRVNHLTNRLIDPAVIYFNNSWHYASPIGAPQAGAYHYVSPNGVNFSAVANIPSDNLHNWTGNYMVESSTELRFYGSGGTIWYNSSPNGGIWNGYVNTNLTNAGDPSVLKIADGNYLIIYVGLTPLTDIESSDNEEDKVLIYPIPCDNSLTIRLTTVSQTTYLLRNQLGEVVRQGEISALTTQINTADLPPAIYFLEIQHKKYKVVKG